MGVRDASWMIPTPANDETASHRSCLLAMRHCAHAWLPGAWSIRYCDLCRSEHVDITPDKVAAHAQEQEPGAGPALRVESLNCRTMQKKYSIVHGSRPRPCTTLQVVCVVCSCVHVHILTPAAAACPPIARAASRTRTSA